MASRGGLAVAASMFVRRPAFCSIRRRNSDGATPPPPQPPPPTETPTEKPQAPYESVLLEVDKTEAVHQGSWTWTSLVAAAGAVALAVEGAKTWKKTEEKGSNEAANCTNQMSQESIKIAELRAESLQSKIQMLERSHDRMASDLRDKIKRVEEKNAVQADRILLLEKENQQKKAHAFSMHCMHLPKPREVEQELRIMEQLRQVGEALGGVNALMAFHDELRINTRQCRLLADAFALAFDAVVGEVRAHLRFDERLTKWKPLEGPLRELHRVVRDGEHYIRQCLEPRDWWARTAASTHGTECVDQHLHNLLWCVAVVIEAIDAVAEVTGSDPDELGRRRQAFAKDLLDPKLFRRRLGKVYLATPDLAARMDMAWKEDRWLLSQLLERKKASSSPEALTRHDHRLADVLTSPRDKLHPASLLLSDFHMRRRLGGSLKEVLWMGEAFAVKHLVGVSADDAAAEFALLTSVSHPNVACCRYGFHDEEKREVFLVMDQLMGKDLAGYVKEVTSAKRRTPFPLVVVVDVMLQIARGMEHLHSKKIYHGNLNPSNVLVKPRHADAYLHVKVAGFGDSGVVAASPTPRKSAAASANANANANVNPCIWYAPEVLGNEGQAAARCTEKADVYSFAMVCFELLTGKIPFEDNHLQGDNTSKNIRAGERPLFPFQSPKYLTSLTRRCWHGDPAQRPAFHSICRVLRYVKRFLVMNPDGGQPDAPAPVPPVDYLDIEAQLLRRLPAAWQDGAAASDVPFQMYAYRVVEKEKTSPVLHINNDAADSSSDGNSLCGDESVHSGSACTATLPDADALSTSVSSRATARSLSLSDRSGSRRSSPRKADVKFAAAKAGPPQKSKSMGVVRPPQFTRRTTPRIKSDGHLRTAVIPPSRRRGTGGHASDSELA